MSNNERLNPKMCEKYWSFNSELEVELNRWDGEDYATKKYDNHNFFKTREEAIAAAEKVKELLESLHESTQSKQFGNSKQLPEWCKVGEWIYCPEEASDDGFYLKISRVDADCIFAKEKEDCDPWQIYPPSFLEHAKRARLRPYNSDEMRSLVGKVVTAENGDTSLVTDYEKYRNKVCVFSDWFTEVELLNSLWYINGAKCGVLEHLNEDEEWVE